MQAASRLLVHSIHTCKHSTRSCILLLQCMASSTPPRAFRMRHPLPPLTCCRTGTGASYVRLYNDGETCANTGNMNIPDATECQNALDALQPNVQSTATQSVSTETLSFRPKGCHSTCYDDYGGYYCRYFNSHESGSGSGTNLGEAPHLQFYVVCASSAGTCTNCPPGKYLSYEGTCIYRGQTVIYISMRFTHIYVQTALSVSLFLGFSLSLSLCVCLPLSHCLVRVCVRASTCYMEHTASRNIENTFYMSRSLSRRFVCAHAC